MAIEINALDGQEVSGATLRLANFQGTSGGNGVILPADLRVRALDVPGAAVQVIRGPSGGAVLVNPAAGAQSYVTHATETEQVPVPATDSSGSKTRYIIQHIDTLNTPGAHYACVDSLTPYANVPHVVLARINQPASTATITAELITDMRRVANPLEHTVSYGYAQRAGDPGQTLTTSAQVGEYFPNAGYAEFEIPWWATRAKIEATWASISYAANKNPWGRCWVEWGPSTGSSTRMYKTQEYGFNGLGGATNSSSGDWHCFDTVNIPETDADGEQLRDTTQRFIFKARYESPDTGVAMNGLSGSNMRVTFQMVAD